MCVTVILMDAHVIQHYTAGNPNGFEERYVPTSVAMNFDPVMCTRTMSVAMSSTLSISSQFTMEMSKYVQHHDNCSPVDGAILMVLMSHPAEEVQVLFRHIILDPCL